VIGFKRLKASRCTSTTNLSAVRDHPEQPFWFQRRAYGRHERSDGDSDSDRQEQGLVGGASRKSLETARKARRAADADLTASNTALIYPCAHRVAGEWKAAKRTSRSTWMFVSSRIENLG